MKKLISSLLSACMIMSSASYAMPVLDFSVEESDSAVYETASKEYSYLSGEDILPEYPGIYADAGYTLTSANGIITAATDEASSYKNFIVVPLSLEEQKTYKMSFDIRIVSHGASKTTKAVVNTSWVFNGEGSIKTQSDGKNHIVSSMSLAISDTFTSYESEITINSLADKSGMAFRAYTNPVRYKNKVVTAPTYEIKNLTVSERCDIVYGAGNYCVLGEGNEEIPLTVGVYNDGTSGTGTVKISDAAMPYVVSDDRWYIDADKPWVDADGNEYASGEEVDVSVIGKTLVLTPNVKTDYSLHTLTFDNSGLSYGPSGVEVISGDTVNLLKYGDAVAAEEGLRFIGWSVTGNKEDIVYEINVTKDTILYPCIGYDYDFAYDDAYVGTTVEGGVLVKKYEGTMLAAKETSDGVSTGVSLGDISLPTSKIKAIRIIFDAYSTDGVADKFTPENVSYFEGVYINTGKSYVADGTVKLLSGNDLCRAEYITENGNQCLALYVDAYKSNYWNGILKFIRINPYAGGPDYAIRKVEFIPYEVLEEKTINLTGLDAPVTGSKKYSPDSVSDLNGIASVTEITWSPELLPGNVFDANTVYTANVVVSPKKELQKIFAKDTEVLIDGAKIDSVFNEDGTITFEKTFAATEDKKKYTVTFDTTGLIESTVPSGVTAFEGTDFYISGYNTANSADSTLRFNGWSTVKGETNTMKALDSVYVDGDITLYPIINQDMNFSCTENHTGWLVYSANYRFTDDGYMVFEPDGSGPVYPFKSGFNINTRLFKGITVYFHPELFKKEQLNWGILFSRAGESESADRILGGRVLGIDPETGYAKVHYSAAGIETWSGVIERFRFDIVSSNTESLYIKAIVFDYYDAVEVDSITVTGIQSPVPGVLDNSAQTVKETSKSGSEFEKIEWSPALKDGRFEANTSYTATVYFSPVSNHIFDFNNIPSMTYNGVTADGKIDSDGRLYASFDIGTTGDYEEFSIEVSGESEIYVDGTTRTYKVAFDRVVADKSVVWTVDNTDLFSIDNNGVLTVKKNCEGTATVRVTSLFNPEVYDEIEVSAKLYDFTAEISGLSEITKAGRSYEYKLITTSEYPIYDRTATWSVDNEDVATIISDSGKLIPRNNGTVVVTAVSNYDPTVVCTYTVEISNQGERYLITFNPGTDDIVTNMPEPITGRGNVSLFTEEPVREGYMFLGWAENDESFNPVSTLPVYADTEVYAVWAKGTMWTFGKNGNHDPNDSSATAYDNYIEADCGPYGYWRLMNLTGLSLDPDIYNSIIVRAAYEGSTHTRIFYKSKYTNANGQQVECGYETDGWIYSEMNAYSVDNERASINQFENLVHHIGRDHKSESPAPWNKADSITTMYIDITRTNGVGFKLQYIAAIDSRRTVSFDANTDDEVIDMPEAMEVLQGDEITLNAKPKREGYEFVGWSKTPNDVRGVKKKFGIVDDLTLYAVWNRVIPGTSSVEDDEKVFVIGDLSLNDNEEAILVKLSDNNRYDVTFSYLDRDGNAKKIVSESLLTGYAVIDLGGISEMYDAKLSISSKISFRSIILTTLENANDISNYVQSDSNGGNTKPPYPEAWNGGSGYMWDWELEDEHFVVESVPNTNEEYNFSQDAIQEDAESSVEAVKPFSKILSGRFPFIDVKKADWFRDDVDKAYRLGLIKGMSDMHYEPLGNVTVAEAITLAVRLNMAYHMEDDTLAIEGEKWYVPYVEEAIARGIIEEGRFTEFNLPAKRREVAVIMAKSVPAEHLGLINRFIEIPDVPRTDSDFEVIRKLYNIGIVQGSDAQYNFYPDTNITRAEMAAIINRIALPENRKRIITENERLSLIKTYTASQIMAAASLVNCDSDKLVMNGEYAAGNAVARDPIVYLNNLITNIKGPFTSTIKIGMKWDTTKVKNPAEAGCMIFFTVAGDESWDIDRRLAGTWNGVLDENGVGEIVFDCTQNEMFNTRVDGIRFDPFSAAASFEIAYIIIE